MQIKAPEVGVALRRALFPEIRSVNEKARTITFVSSDESVDRYGDVIRCAGWDYQSYLRNPVVLWSHQSDELPVGKCVNLTVETFPPALVQVVEFATHDFASTVFDLYKGKFLNAVSVGFMPTSQPMPMKDADGNMTGWEFNGQELLELSCTPLPANPNALARARAAGFAEEFLQRAFGTEEVPKTVAALKQTISDLKAEIAALKTSPPQSMEPAEDEQPGSSADLAEEIGEALDEIAASVADAQKLCESLESQLEPGDTGNDAIKPPKQRHAPAPNKSVSEILARVVKSGKRLAAEKSPASDESEITSLEQLGESEHDITTLTELGEALRPSEK